VGSSGSKGFKHALDRGYEVVGVRREQGVGKLDGFRERIAVVPGATNDREVIKRAVVGCDGALVLACGVAALAAAGSTVRAAECSARVPSSDRRMRWAAGVVVLSLRLFTN
jgi:putative NADH-flavin reductase